MTGHSSLEYAVQNASGVPYTGWLTLVVSGSPMDHTTSLRATGDRVQYRKPGDSTISALSGAVTISNTAAAKINSVTPAGGTTVATGTEVTFNIGTSGLTSVGYVLVGGADVNYAWQTQPVYVPTTGSVNVKATITASDQFVKALPPVGVDIPALDSARMTVTSITVPGSVSADKTFVKTFLQDLTVGVNIEREAGGGRDAAYFTKLMAAGITHVRLFVPTKASWGFASSDTLKYFYDTISAAISVGMKVLFALQDVCEPGDVENEGTLTYLQRCGSEIAARNFDVRKYAVAAINEHAYMTNAYYEPYRNTFAKALAAKLPQTIIMTASAIGGHPTP